MSIQDQLRLRAFRMLRDAYEHSDAAICWAVGMVRPPDQVQQQLEQSGDMPPLTLRELSLGATDFQ